MKLEGILGSLQYELIQGELDINIKGICSDSRKCQEGYLFVAITGFETDGHKYIFQSIQAKALAIVVEYIDFELTDIPEQVTVIKVKNSRKVLAYLANKFYNNPSSQFKLVGVTGTNGKTTTVTLMNNVLEYLGRKTGLIGTIANKIDDLVLPAARTTPESLELQQLFSEMATKNISNVVMEVSSHALDLYRVAYCQFDVGIFTNLTLDHLDYHKTMENYGQAKAKLFRMCKVGVINIDDAYADQMLEQTKQAITYSTKEPKADLYGTEIKTSLDGVDFRLIYDQQSYPVHIQTPGKFSVYNALAAIGGLIALNIDIETIIQALAQNSQVKGRFQGISSPTGYTAIVDYAHAPDGLENVLTAIKEFVENRIITVFGCGGDRDKTKRPIMGQISGRLSDYSIITSDNPRTEVPIDIMKDIEQGLRQVSQQYEMIEDRRQAIEHALEIAEKGDIVLVAGKGHEDYQIIGKEKIHFDDEEVIRHYLEENQ